MGVTFIHKWILIGWLSLLTQTLAAQPNPPAGSGTIVLFLPLHLDSIFSPQDEYRYPKYEFPRFAGGPLEFYQGFRDALDSLKIKPGQTDLIVVDSRSTKTSLTKSTEKSSINQANAWLLFGNASESRTLAAKAKAYQIPLININLPNDAGIEANPYYFMWNSTLATQCEGIYKHLQQHYALHQIIVVRKKGNMEDRILSYWKEYEKRTPGVRLKYQLLEMEDSLSLSLLKNYTDSTQQTLLVGASLDERFARNLATAAANLQGMGYKIELMGMPTWDNIREFSTNRYRNLEVIIPSPFYYPKTDELSKWLQNRYQYNYYGKISDLYARGYEMAWLLHPYLSSNKNELLKILPGRRKLLFAEVDWQAVKNPISLQTSYFENKKLYFVKRMEGNIRSVR